MVNFYVLVQTAPHSEEPDYKEHDETSPPVPQPDTEDQPVSVWASSLCSSHAGLQVAAAAPPIK